MQFLVSEGEEKIKKLAREFAAKELAPGVAERDEKEEFSRELYRKLTGIGIAGISYPEKYGGSGGSFSEYVGAVEEVAQIDDGIVVGLSASVCLCAWPIFTFGSEEQRQKYLVPLVKGEKIGAFGLTERGAGTDAASQQTVAVRDGDRYILNGSKIFITNGGEAETYVIFAMTDKSKGVKGISAFILEKGMPGFTFGEKEQKLGIRSSPTSELFFREVAVPAQNVLGKIGEGFKIAMQTLDLGRVSVAAQALGIAQAALDQALTYAKKRVQFGKSIASNQAVAFMLADMATKVDAARLLVYRAANLKDAGLPYAKEAAMAKMYASDAAMSVATDAVQIFGGYGYMREYPVQRLLRDAKITQIYEGTNQVQRMVIAAALLK